MSKNNSIKIGTKKEVLWTEVVNASKEEITQLEKKLEVNKELLKVAEKIIAEEAKK